MGVVICSDAASRTIDGKSSFGYVAMLKRSIIDAGAWLGPKVTPSKEPEVGVVLAVLKRAIEKGYARIRVCLDAIKVVCAINDKFDWVINPITADIKKLSLNFTLVEFSYIPKSLNYTAHSLAKLSYLCNLDIDQERTLLFFQVGC